MSCGTLRKRVSVTLSVLLVGAAVALADCPVCKGEKTIMCDRCDGLWNKTEVVVDCAACGGAGQRACPVCHGRLTLRCTKCGGDGKIRKQVGTRRGNGVIQPTYTDRMCLNCSGRGEVPCKTCNYDSELRASGAGRGVITCTACKGAGKKRRFGPCPVCDRGKIPCPRCTVFSMLKDSRPPARRDFFDVFVDAAKERDVCLADDELAKKLLLTPVSVGHRIDYWLEANDERSDGIYSDAKRYRDEVARLFSTIADATKLQLRFFARDVPLDFATKDGQSTFIVTGMVSDLRVDSTRMHSLEQRATAVAESLLAPVLTPVYQSFQASDIENFGFVISYGARNFADADELGTLESECLAVLIPAQRCFDYARGRITFGELLHYCECYVADRNRATGLGKTHLPR